MSKNGAITRGRELIVTNRAVTSPLTSFLREWN